MRDKMPKTIGSKKMNGRTEDVASMELAEDLVTIDHYRIQLRTAMTFLAKTSPNTKHRKRRNLSEMNLF
jgi:hypothetical protein